MLTGHPDEYADTVPRWAADGFVVASPAFPLTNREVPGVRANLADVVNQPGDVSFVIDEVLAANEDPSSPLHGLVDADAIGVVGHSLGGATTWAVSFNTATRDERIDSAVIFAGVTIPMPGGEFEFDSGLPLLVMHGDRDDVPLDSDLAAYDQAVSPKWFVTLLGADHVPAFTDRESPHDELVTRTVLDFWHGTLDSDARALERVTADATDPALPCRAQIGDPVSPMTDSPDGRFCVPGARSHEAAVGRPACQLVTARQLELAQHRGHVASRPS